MLRRSRFPEPLPADCPHAPRSRAQACPHALVRTQSGQTRPGRGMNERELLARLIHGPASGATLARGSNQTRAAIWKRVHALREAGIAIEVRPGHGYARSEEHTSDLQSLM